MKTNAQIVIVDSEPLPERSRQMCILDPLLCSLNRYHLHLNEGRKSQIFVVILCIYAFCVYLPAMCYDFVLYDDGGYVFQNPWVVSGLSLRNLFWAFSTLHAHVSYWHPLTWISHQLDCQVFGLRPGAHHLTNIVLHLGNMMFVYALLKLATGQALPSLVVAALFGLHPLHVESVAWIAERKDVLSTFFVLLTLYTYVRYAQTSSPPWYYAAIAFYTAAVMSKPMVVTLPVLLLLLDFWPLRRMPILRGRQEMGVVPGVRRAGDAPAGDEVPNERSVCETRSWGQLLGEKLPFCVLSWMLCVVTFIAQKAVGTMAPLSALPISARLDNAIVAYCVYLLKTLLPVRLCVIYPLRPWPTAVVLLSAVILLGITCVIARCSTRYPCLLFGWAWYFVGLVPTIGIVQVGGQAMADRYSYLPIVGLFVAMVWFSYEWSGSTTRRRSLFVGVHVVVLVILAVMTSWQLRYWQDSEALFRHAIAVTQHNYIANCNLGIALTAQNRFEEANTRFEAALQLRPDSVDTYRHYGISLIAQGRLPKALTMLDEALTRDPNLAELHFVKANVLSTHAEGRFRNAMEAAFHAERACELTHFQNAEYIGTLAAAYAEGGYWPQAMRLTKQATSIAAAFHQEWVVRRLEQLRVLFAMGKPLRHPEGWRDYLDL